MLDRRRFLNVLSAGTAALWTGTHDSPLEALAGARRLGPVGLGLFSIPHLLEQDLEKTMALLGEIGYEEVETFGPYPFSAPSAHERWNSLTGALGFTQSGYFGRTAREFRAVLDEAGLSSPSMHIDLETLQTRMDQVGEAVQTLGQAYAGISAIPDAIRTSLDDYRRIADEFNEIGSQAARHGFKFLYHNHGYGLAPMEWEIPLRILIDRLDPEVVALEMDLYWTIAGGADPLDYLEAYPEHYRLLHIKDMSEHVRFDGDGGDAQQWMALFPYMASVGRGVLDLPTILAKARATGVRHYLVERDLAPEPEKMLRTSYAYLKGL